MQNSLLREAVFYAEFGLLECCEDAETKEIALRRVMGAPYLCSLDLICFMSSCFMSFSIRAGISFVAYS